MKKLLLFAIGLGLFAVSCNKNLENKGPVDATKQKMLMDKAWQIKAFEITPNMDFPENVQDAYKATYPDCAQDDYFVFRTKDSVTWHDNWVKCLLDDPDSKNYLYSLRNNEKDLVVWSDPEEPDNSIIMWGQMEYPSVDTFILKWETVDEATSIKTGYKQTFVKILPE